MMASPAVGSLLFSLKELDREHENKPNYDEAYNEMLNDSKECRIVVCGSSVGGTGSSVAPTLARLCNDKGAEVMTVMVHNWFKFREPDDNREIFDKSVERNKRMKQNAAGGLACYGNELAGSVPTVLVGVPRDSLTMRDYTTDNQQQFLDSCAHVVGALAGITHFMTGSEGEDKIKKGLYGVSASDTRHLTGDIIVGDGASLRTMVGHVQFLIYLLKAFSKLLRETSKRDPSTNKSSFLKFFDFAGHTPFPTIAEWAYEQLNHDHSKLEYVANELDKIVEIYDEKQTSNDSRRGLLHWITSFKSQDGESLDYDTDLVEKRSRQSFLPELRVIAREKSHSLPKVAELRNSRLAHLGNVEIVALALFHWIADWITDDWKKVNPEPGSQPSTEGQGYWPDIVSRGDTGLVPTWKKPGVLGKVADGKTITTIKNHFDRRDVSPNGWPHPVSVIEHYKFQITNEDPVALRKLEILLIGRALHILELKRVETEDNKGDISLERLLKDENIAEYRLIHKERGTVYGFNSPDTLLCPVPDVSDEDWEALRNDIIASDWNDWKKSENWRETLKKAGTSTFHNPRSAIGSIRSKVAEVEQDKINWKDSTYWGTQGEKARSCIKGWLKCTEGYIKGTVDEDSRTWVDVFDEYFDSEPGPFGIAEGLPLPAEKVRVPVPILGASTHLFEDTELDKREAEKRRPEFLDRASEFRECLVTKLGKSETFQLVRDFRFPGGDYPIQAIWKEHLDALQEKGIIFAWQMDPTDRGVWIREKLGDSPIYFKDLQVIDRDAIQIITCIPLEQNPVSGPRDKKLKCPDIPLRPEYIDLLKIPKNEKHEGEKCINHDAAWRALKQSGEVDKAHQVVRWKLDLLGRSEPVSIAVSIDNIKPAKAHWMIWPNIKSPFHPDESHDQWRAYYVYEHSDRESLKTQIIYLDQKGNLSAIKKAPPGCPGNSYALDFKDGQHVGGPPVALSAYDQKLLDTGIYVISLQEHSRDKEPWKLAIDFGTSHTVAAYQINGAKGARPVNLDPELATDDGLSLHVSENYDVRGVTEMGPDIWRPTYNKEESDEISRALLPSDLWSMEDLKFLNTGTFKTEWSPMTHYSIPAMQLRRSNLQDHIISGFKWDLNGGAFRGAEQWLRRRYLSMAIEIFVADIVKKTRTLPKEIVTTFTYPLRGTITQATDNYEKVIRRLLEASTHDLGVSFSLCENRGMYSESHAASDSVGDGIPINIKLVADLGGGTLDILISTYDIPSERENNRFDEVEDSVQIGSDLLLEVLAGNPTSYLPKGTDRGWELENAFEQLRAWMRSVGSEKLFGMDSRNWHDPNLKLTGFNMRQDGNHARELINRYFRMITDFLARYLVAYVAKDVLPELKTDSDRNKLKLLVNLRGNGWRLWHGSRNYRDIQQTMEALVRERAAQLWTEAGLADALPDSVWHSADLIHQNSPKLAPILKAVGQNMDPELARKRSHRFPLSKVAVLRRGQDDKQFNWFEKSPFRGVSADDSLHVDDFDPPLVVHDPKSRDPLKKIEDELMKTINNSISGNQAIRDPLSNTIDAPIAVLIWENLLKSDKFRKI